MKKLKWWILGISTASILSLLVAMGVIFTLFSGSLNGHDCDSSDNPSIEVSSRPSGSYTDKNSEEYKNAKGIFDTLTKEVGFSGAGAAGAIGNSIGESGLKLHNPNTGGGVNGLFQWSGWGNTVNGSRITSEGSIKAGDVSTLTLENELKLMKFELNGAYKKVKTLVGKETDVKKATMNWFLYYEGMLGNEDQYGSLREGGAEWAYQEFGGASVTADDSILGNTTKASLD